MYMYLFSGFIFIMYMYMYTHTFLVYIQVKFPSPGFLSSQKLKELAKLLPAPEEPMHTNDDYYEEVQYTCACTVTVCI